MAASKILLPITATILIHAPLFAQSELKNDISIAGAAATNTGGLYPLNGTAADIGVAYGYRFGKYLQADLAFDTTIHPVGHLDGGINFNTNDYLFATHGRSRQLQLKAGG